MASLISEIDGRTTEMSNIRYNPRCPPSATPFFSFFFFFLPNRPWFSFSFSFTPSSSSSSFILGIL
jgi:hypothetical protein